MEGKNSLVLHEGGDCFFSSKSNPQKSAGKHKRKKRPIDNIIYPAISETLYLYMNLTNTHNTYLSQITSEVNERTSVVVGDW